MSSNQLVLVLDARLCNNIIVPLPSLIPGLLARPSYPPLVLEVGSGPQIPIFHNSTYLDLQVGLVKNLGACQKRCSSQFKLNTCAFVSLINNNIVLSKNVNSKDMYKKKVW